MKPIIIYQETDNDKIIISKEEFEKLITAIYEQGKQDGNTYPIIYQSTPIYQPSSYPLITWASNTAECKYPNYTASLS